MIKRDGFILVILMVTIALMGAEIFILTEGTDTILYQANYAYLEAVEQNLIVSGLAWAKKNIKNGNIVSFNKTIELNLADINIKRATLSVVIEEPKNKQTEIHINSSCVYGRQTLKHRGKYQIDYVE